MILFTTSLLLVTSTLAADYGQYQGHLSNLPSGSSPQVIPIDYSDDIYNPDFWTKPNSNFVYNFEQTRRDQPPHIEQRQENVGKYIQRRPHSTTQAPIFASKVNYGTIRTITQQHHLPGVSTIPPPPSTASNWQDTHRSVVQHTQPQYQPSSAWNVQPIQNQHVNTVNTYQHQPAHVPTQAAMTEVPMVHNKDRAPNPTLRLVPSYPKANSPAPEPKPEEIRFAPSASYVPEPVAPSQPQTHHQSIPSRGQHKFNWGDMKNEALAPIVTPSNVNQAQSPSTPVPGAPAPLGPNNPPPPVPTLSPWYDGFGK